MIIEKLFNRFAAPPAGCEHSFLTLHTWYHYIPRSHFKGCDITKFVLFPVGGAKSDVPLVLAAIIDDLLQIAGLVALAFVLVGAIKYISSQGSPDATASAQGTVINALLGLAIAITGVVFVNFIGNTLGK